MMTLRYWFSVLTLFFASALFADNAKCWNALRERFPELNLPESQPTFRTATSYDTLKTAISDAISTSGDDVILLDGRSNQTWEGSSTIEIVGDAANGSLFIVSQNPETGDFNTPVTFKGFGIATGRTNTTPLFLALFGITESRTVTTFIRSGGLSLMGSGAVIGSCLSITNCGTDAAGQYCWGGGLYGVGPAVTLYNTTIANTKTTIATYGAVTNMGTSSVTLVHCTLTANTSTTYGTVTTTNCLITSNTLEAVNAEGMLPCYLPETVNTATATTTLTYDALGKKRVVGDAADLGAVEIQPKLTVEPPSDLVALPSGPREVYLGWTPIAVAQDYQLERSTDDGATWNNITAETLWRTAYNEISNLEGCASEWTSARYYNATPGESANYRLSFTADGVEGRIYAEVKTVTTPALNAVPQLHSRKGAKRVIYLDFMGYVDDYWGSVEAARKGLKDSTLKYVKTSPFDYIGYRYITSTERYPTADAITDIWRMVAEDFATFDVDVTTEAPSRDALIKSSEEDDTYGKRVVIGYAEGNSTPWYMDGGAFSGGGTFGFPHDRPAYVFSVQSRQNIAAQATHEVSHTLGLAHDGGKIYLPSAYIRNENNELVLVYDYFSPKPDSYYQGVELTRDGTPNRTSYRQTGLFWYPIMGGAPLASSYGEKYYDDYDYINQWNNGTYSSATNKEDDFAILLGLKEGSKTPFTEKETAYSCATRNITLIEDDAGDDFATAVQLDLTNAISRNGIISKHLSADNTTVTNDCDVFAVTLKQPGTLHVLVEPNFDGMTEGASLDAQIEVFTATGERLLCATEPIWAADANYFDTIRNAECQIELPLAGTYYLRVSGTNHPVSSTTLSPDQSASAETPWNFNATDNNGSIGPYTLTASFDANETLSLPKPSVGDTTNYTSTAMARLFEAAGQKWPKTITLTNGSATPTAATLSSALEVFNNVLTYDAETDTATVAYTFTITEILPSDDAIVLTLHVSGDNEATPVTFAEDITIRCVDAWDESKSVTLSSKPEPIGTATPSDTLRITFPRDNLPNIFRILLQ